MNLPRYLILLISLISFGGCIRYAYYQSPLQSNAASYHAIPLHSEEKKSEIYASIAAGGGGANYLLNDGVSSFSGTIHRGSNFGNFQGYYGLSVKAGTYDVNRVGSGRGLFDENIFIDSVFINSHVGTRGYFAAGLVGGMNYVRATSGGEWRVIGVDFSWHNEAGRYLYFRKMLPDSSANLIDRRHTFVTIGLNTDVLRATKNGSVGFQFGIVIRPQTLTEYTTAGTALKYKPAYLSQTIHVETRKAGGFFNMSFGGRAMIATLGGSLKLSRRSFNK